MTDILSIAKQRFDKIVEYESENRNNSKEDIKFATADSNNQAQWRESALLERKGRPSLVINKIAGVLKTLRGQQRQLKPSIKVRPVDSESDPQKAKIINGLIRNIEYGSSAESSYSTSFSQTIEGGFGFFRINTQYIDDTTFDQEIIIERIPNQFSVYIDPDYTNADASDIKWAFVIKQFTHEDFRMKYPKADMVSWSDDDGMKFSKWWSSDYIQVAEYWYTETTKIPAYHRAHQPFLFSFRRPLSQTGPINKPLLDHLR